MTWLWPFVAFAFVASAYAFARSSYHVGTVVGMRNGARVCAAQLRSFEHEDAARMWDKEALELDAMIDGWKWRRRWVRDYRP